MKIFISFPYQDGEDVFELLPDIGDNEILFLKRRRFNFLWKLFARHKIIMSDCILCLVSHRTFSSKNVLWELNNALMHGKKLFYYKLDCASAIPTVLANNGIEVKSLFHICDFMKKHNEQVIIDKLLNGEKAPIIKGASSWNKFFEQYKIMVKSSEELSKKRQKMHTFFVTINGAIFSCFGVVSKNISSFCDISLGMIFIYIMLSIIGIFVSYSWKKQIISYRQLSGGKFKIINSMEKYLPAAIYSAEWTALSEGKDKKVYTSFTANEKNIPIALKWIYVMFIILSMIAILFKLKDG